MYESNTQVKEFLISVIRSSPYGVLTIDLKGKVTLTNSLVLEYLNIQKNITEVIDADFTGMISHITLLKQIINECVSVTRKSFDLERVEVNDLYLKIKGRKILNGLLITIEDITHEIKTHNALEKSKKELEELTEVSAHDIKSHLTSLSGLVDLLDQENAVKKDYLDAFNRAKRSLSTVSDKVKTLSDVIEFNKTLKLKPKKVRLQEQLNLVLDNIAELINNNDAKIEADFSAYPTIKLPPEHVRRIFYNLITNGIKFRKENSKPSIKIRSYTHQEFLGLEIMDNGTGFSVKQQKDKLYKIFQKFNTTVPGMGVGLYMVNEIVTAYGGKIRIKSRVGQGTSFNLYFKK